ncbi:coiled-coil domain-containing protein [Mycoplasmopsis alligatoris]|uniref:Uncharacterized protein n=1 Tax=Mycoplasmopsis alligatoris A21JP2 TaxID=747682 RepID=D4XWD3_9BACT|nr:hypothetical protein [Mycoplasmopsis alligatoris]EFF41214.1 conserved hypothetical protein [Mycoplasmopsis alligatoris A21JP2]
MKLIDILKKLEELFDKDAILEMNIKTMTKTKKNKVIIYEKIIQEKIEDDMKKNECDLKFELITKDINDLKTEIKNLNTKFDHLVTIVLDLSKTVQQNHSITMSRLDKLEQDVSVLKTEMKEVKEDIKILKAEMKEVKEDIKILKTEMKEVKEFVGFPSYL